MTRSDWIRRVLSIELSRFYHGALCTLLALDRVAERSRPVSGQKAPEAKEIADRFFFETLVRLHRMSENAPLTGLKDEPLEDSIALADKALESGSADELIHRTTAHVAGQLRQRFAAASEASTKPIQ